MKAVTQVRDRWSAGVSPAVVGASRSRTKEVLTSSEKREAETEGGGQGARATAGRMPALHMWRNALGISMGLRVYCALVGTGFRSR